MTMNLSIVMLGRSWIDWLMFLENVGLIIKQHLAKHAYNNLIPSTPTQEELNQEMVRLAKELHPLYKEKIANNLYNYSFETLFDDNV